MASALHRETFMCDQDHKDVVSAANRGTECFLYVGQLVFILVSAAECVISGENTFVGLLFNICTFSGLILRMWTGLKLLFISCYIL